MWENGISCWSDLITALNGGRLPVPPRPEWVEILRRSQLELARLNSLFFARALPSSEHWRLYGSFSSQTLFLDIETTGLNPDDTITVIGCSLGGLYRSFVSGRNLDEAPALIASASLMVTFNGTYFDIPFLQKTFPSHPLPRVHLDLRDLLRRLGIRGTQKEIEIRLGIVRKDAVKYLTGRDAVFLWEAHQRGDPAALPRLIEYNREDVRCLKELMDYAYRQLKARLGW